MQRGLDVCGDVGREMEEGSGGGEWRRGGSKVEGDGYLGEEDLEIHVNSWKLVCGDRLSLSLLLREGGRGRGREGGREEKEGGREEKEEREGGREGDVDSG